MTAVETALLDGLRATLRHRVRVLGRLVGSGHLSEVRVLHDLVSGPVVRFCRQHPFAWDVLEELEAELAIDLADAAAVATRAMAPAPLDWLLHPVRLPGRTTTGLPPYYPAPTEDKLAALVRLDLTITGFVATEARKAGARRVLAQRRDAALAMALDALPHEKAAITRRIHAEVAAEFGYGKRIPHAGRLLVTGSQGIGKTRLMVTALTRVREPIVIRVVEQTLAKAAEVLADYAKAAGPDSLQAMLVQGRAALDPDAPPPNAGVPAARMCARHEVAAEVAARGLSVRKALCAACPLAAGCAYLRQDARIRAMGGRGIYFMAHASLFTASPAPVADLTFVDERLEGTEVVELPLSVLAPAALPYRGGPSLAAITAVHRTLDLVRNALAQHEPLAVLRAAGMTEETLRDAVRLLEPVAHPDPGIVNGGMADAAILDRLAMVECTGAGQAMTVLRAILREWDRARPTLVSVMLDASGTVSVRRLRRVQGIGQGGVLLLDGTGRAEGLQRTMFGARLREEVIRLDRQAHVTGTTGKHYSRQSITGLDMYARALPNRTSASRKLRDDIATIAERLPGPCLVGTAKGAAEALGDMLTSDLPQATYGAHRGLNTWEQCESAVVVGAPPMSMRTLEDLARAVLADDDAPFISADVPMPKDWPYRDRGWPYWQTRMRRMRDGTVSPVEVPVHPDPRVQAILEEHREAGVVQLADRVRPMFQHRNLVLMNSLVLDMTYDVELTHAELVAGGNRYAVAFAAAGMRPRGARDLHALFPHLFPTLKAAERWIERGGLSTPIPPTVSCWGRGGTYFYRLKGQRGSLSSIDMDTTMHPDPRAALTAALGPLVWFEAMDAPGPVETTPAPAPAPIPPRPVPPPPALRPWVDADWPPYADNQPWWPVPAPVESPRGPLLQ